MQKSTSHLLLMILTFLFFYLKMLLRNSYSRLFIFSPVLITEYLQRTFLFPLFKTIQRGHLALAAIQENSNAPVYLVMSQRKYQKKQI